MSASQRNLYEFGPFELDPNLPLLLHDGAPLPLPPKALETLVVLVKQSGRVVSREELIEAVWPDAVVEENNLSVNISMLRKVLGQANGGKKYIETVSRRGYRFTGQVREILFENRELIYTRHTRSQILIEESHETDAVEPGTAPYDENEWGEPGSVSVTKPTPSTLQFPGLTRWDLSDSRMIAVGARPPTRRGRLIWFALMIAMLTGAIFWVYFHRPASRPATRSDSESSLTPVKMTLLTSFPGREEWPKFSPDGNQIAFTWSGEKGDNMDIYVKITDAGTPLRLTTDPGIDNGPDWSNDGKYIAFTRFGQGESSVFLVPALGGPERKLLSLGIESHWFGNYASVVWSPDGQSLAFPDKSSPMDLPGITLASVETGEKRRLTSPPAHYIGDWFPAFSPDGRYLAFTRSSSEGAADVYVIPVLGGEPRRLTFDNTWTVGPVWTPDGGSIVFLSLRGGTLRLWKISASGGASELLATGGQTFMVQQHPSPPSISRQGKRLVIAKFFEDINIWRMEVSRSTGRGTSPTKLISSTQYDGAPQFSPDGQKIVFQSERSGLSDIWICDREGANVRQLTFIGGPLVGTPRWSPDGRHIAFDARTEGHSDIYLVDSEGGRPRRITTETSNDVVPSWSRNGRYLYFASNRTGTRPEVWKAPVAGGEAQQVTKQGGFAAFESPDGEYLYYSKLDAAGLWKIPVEGGEESLVLNQLKPREWGYWTVGDRGIYFINSGSKPRATIEFLSFTTSRVTLIATIEKEPINWASNLSISPDGRWILYTQVDQSDSDIMMMKTFTETDALAKAALVILRIE